MDITFSIIDFFIGVGGILALILSIAFITHSKTNKTSIWLLGFCFANVFVILVKILYSTGYIYELPYLLRWKFPIGISRPIFFFLFILYLYKGYEKIKARHMFHFIPVIIVLIYFVPFFFTANEAKIAWLKGEQIFQNANLPGWYFYFISFYSLFYLSVSFFVFLKNKHLTQKKLNTFISTIFIITAIYLFVAIINSYIGRSPDLVNAMYLIISIGILIVSFLLLSSQTGLIISKNIKYKSSNINQKRSQEIFIQAKKITEQTKLYKEPDFKMTDLAEKVNVPSYLLSNAINQHTGKTFTDFINQMRIDEAVNLMSNGMNEHLTLEAIGYEVGFNSRSSFYSAFKKIKNSSPSVLKKTSLQ